MFKKPAFIKAKIKVLLTGGGSGGHLYPLIAVSEELINIAYNEGIDLSLDYLGPIDPRVKNEFEIIGIQPHSLLAGKLRRYASLVILLDIPAFFISIFQALFKVWLIMPDVLFSKGGSGALPVVLACRFYRIPVMIHESDAVPGTTNYISGRHFSKAIGVSFQKAASYFDPGKTAVVGNPIRSTLLYKRPAQADAKTLVGLDPKKPVMFIIGGSLGSQRLNDFIVDNLREILSVTQIIHQTGIKNFDGVKEEVKSLFGDDVQAQRSGYIFFPFLDENLKTAYSAADVVVSRAGAGAIFEAASFGKPMILIPLPEAANDHQRENAYEFAQTGGGAVIEEDNLLPDIFIGQIKEIVDNPEKAEQMSGASLKFFIPGAAESLAKEIIKITGN
ncbi:UDP-N-acetylglucosamine--N-acetylmuramyl-(pentapeptide) pyrophosphoryl-undecaprenol N-acetylglucosamine transferase [Patescibacteria group bacterium]|nr:UDP-N-acetylglucosamine--N-acetylmuramyl-(pentapeptide) pyrophosphoryl-undecaprenol N-acetylglucosamine transferase [Patescibacteria group bacterium]